jgi:hypothetical protein
MCRRLTAFFRRLCVVLEGRLNAFVAHSQLNDFGVDTGSNQHGGVGAAQVVEREVGETGLPDDFVQDSIRDVSIVEGFPLL